MSMTRVVPTESFTGYPEDIKTRFEQGVEANVPQAYADILVEKGLATRTGTKSKTKRTAPDAADE
jgi:hypothetical protein